MKYHSLANWLDNVTTGIYTFFGKVQRMKAPGKSK